MNDPAGLQGGLDSGAGPLSVLDIVAGNSHTCVLLSDGRVACWGAMDMRQAGHAGTMQASVGPGWIAGPQNFISLAAGENVTCGVVMEGDVYCWGAVSDGGGVQDYYQVPGLVGEGPLSVGVRTAVDGVVTDELVCVLTQRAAVECRRAHQLSVVVGVHRTLDTSPPDFPPTYQVEEVAAGFMHLLTQGYSEAIPEVRSLGRDGQGQAGDDERQDGLVLLDGVRHIAAAHRRSCAATNTQVFCWGEAGFPDSSLSRVDLTAPSAMLGTPGAISDLDISRELGCAIVAGEVKCWGTTVDPEGDPETTHSVRAYPRNSGEGQGRLVAAGMSHICDVVGATSVRCFGLNTSRQLGAGAEPEQLGVIDDLLAEQ